MNPTASSLAAVEVTVPELAEVLVLDVPVHVEGSGVPRR